MPSPILALDLIKTAMRLIGVLAPGETPTAEEATDGLQALNDVLDTWNTESLALWQTLPVTFATIGGQASYTLGPGGNWNTERPTQMFGAYTTVQGVDFPIAEWTLAQYESVGIKTQQQQIVERFVFVNDMPLARVLLYPTPFSAVPITLDLPHLLTQPATIATTLVVAPGYARALQYAVGLELAPQYGSPIDVSAQAKSTMAKIKRANRTTPVSTFDSTILAPRPAIPARGY